MPTITAGKLCKAMNGNWINGEPNIEIHGIISKHTKVKLGFLYFDVKGYKVGNLYILEAVKNGAAAIVISQDKDKPPMDNPNVAVIAVPNLWEAFWKTVKYYRDIYDIPVVGVTGTSGKTTTSEMIASIFCKRWKTLMTPKNLNLPQFVPQQIMRLNNGFESAVFEIGMNKQNQISNQARIIQPKVGVITNIGAGHLKHLKSLENVILEKSGIMKGIPDDGYLVLNIDDNATKKIDISGFKGEVIYYGLINKADYMASNLKIKDGGTYFKVSIDGKQYKFFIPTYGRHNVYNALVAIAVAKLFYFDVETIKKGLANYVKPPRRLQIVKGIKNSVLIDDTYNANPNSVMAGLEVLTTLTGNNTSVAVLGNMLEQGEYTIKNHRKIGKVVEALNINWLITVGTMAKEIAKGVTSNKIKKWSFDWNKEAVNFLRKKLPKNSVILVKGSRGARMENVVLGLKSPLIFDIPTIAVTGSAGKTTTKEMIASVLGAKWNILKSEKTNNQRYHTKKYADQIHSGHQAAVLEFGMGRKNAGRIHCSHIQPNISVITNIGTAHYGRLGNSIKSTAQSKSALISYMKPDGILLVNKDDKNYKLLNTTNFKGEIITVGINKKADYQAEDVKYLKKGMSFNVRLNRKKENFFISAFGSYNVINALFAVAISHRLKFKPSEIKAGLKKFKAPNMRLNLIKLRNKSLLIDDSHNSNPEAVKAAVGTFIKLGKGKKKIVVLGSMLELGKYSFKGHEEVGQYLAKNDIDVICTYGEYAKFIKTGAVNAGHKNVKHFLNRDKMHTWLKQNIKPKTAILVKGSNRMNMYSTVNFLIHELSKVSHP